MLYVHFSTDSGKSEFARPIERFRGCLIRILTRSNFDHVAVGVGKQVATSTLDSCHIVWAEHYLKNVNVIATIHVSTSHEIDLKQFGEWPGTHWIWSPLRWLTCGRFFWNTDCVCMTLAALRRSGLAPPRSITTPKGIYEWLKRCDRAVVASS